MIKCPEIILRQRNLIAKAELSTAKFCLIEQLIETLKTEKATQSFMMHLERKVVERQSCDHQDTVDSVKWIRKNIENLKKSKWKNHPIVRETLDVADTVIFCKDFSEGLVEDQVKNYITKILQISISHSYPVYGFVGRALNALAEIAQIIAEFGEKELFKGWAEIQEVKETIFLDKILPNHSLKKIKTMNLSQIAEETKYGFSKFQAKNVKSKSMQPLVEYEQCRLIQLIHPPCIERILSKYRPDTLYQWTESRDTDPVTLYHHLKILSLYPQYKEMNLRSIKAPVSWEEHELLAVKDSLKIFFGKFLSTDLKSHPLISQQIIDQVDTFLEMIEIQLLRPSQVTLRKTSRKDDAKDFLIKHINSDLDKKEPGTGRTNKEMHTKMIKIAQIRNEPFVNDLSVNLVSDVYREVLSKRGIKRKGGAPRKKKNQK